MHCCAMNVRDKSPVISSAKRGFLFILSSSCISQEKLVICHPYFTALSCTEMWELSWMYAMESRPILFPVYQSLMRRSHKVLLHGKYGPSFSAPHIFCALVTCPVFSFTMYSTDRKLKTFPPSFNRIVVGSNLS